MADAGRVRSRSTASVDVPSGQLAPILRAILQHNDQIVEQNQAILQLLNYHVQNLPAETKIPPLPKTGRDLLRLSSQRTAVAGQHTHTRSLSGSDHENASTTSPKPAESADAEAVSSMWDAILRDSSRRSPEFLKEYHRWERPWTIQEAFLGRHEWTSRGYEWAYPQLVSFLRGDAATKKCHAQVLINDYAGAEISSVVSAYNESRPRVGLLRGLRVPVKVFDGARRRVGEAMAEDPFGCKLLWQALNGCACSTQFGSEEDVKSDAIHRCMRAINIRDVSPKVLTCLLASTPKVDLSYLAAFLQRHLVGSNWGKATRLRYGEHLSSYTLEYHFSCYYVTPNLQELAAMRQDLRGQRKSARFGIGQTPRSKYIHEETLSFLYLGHFKDVATCIQLAESYFKYDPYRVQEFDASDTSMFRSLQPGEPGSVLFLSWISVALHHVLWRWQSAIDAVHSEIKTSRHIVFMDDRNDLMSDDPSFSLSKTYFWALQVYKLFDDTISETVTAWEVFRERSLPQLRDHRVSELDWNRTVGNVDDAIGELRKKVEKIRTMSEEVKELRKGLISASALFDSRTSVRQGENIRLLTYITLLFLPLSFATSIFGMQFMGTTNAYIYAFVSVLPAVTILTALFIFNLHNITESWDRLADTVGGWLREAMTRNHRNVWQTRAVALQQDIEVARAPVRKVHKETTSWVYLVFILEWTLVALPVGELANATSLPHRILGGETKLPGDEVEGSAARDEATPVGRTVMDKINNSMAVEREKRRWERKKRIGGAFLTLEDIYRATPSALSWTGKVMLDVARLLLLPLWTVIILCEYCILLLYFTLSPPFKGNTSETSKPTLPREQSTTPRNAPWSHAYHALGLERAFPPKSHDVATDASDRQTRARRKLSRIPAQPDDKPNGSRKSGQSNAEAVVPLPRSAPQLRRSPLPSPAVEDRPKTFLSTISIGNKDPSRDTMDFIEAMSRTSTPVPPRPLSPYISSPQSSTTALAPTAARARTPDRQPPSEPPSKLPPGPPQRQYASPARNRTVAPAPRSPTIATDASSSRPGTATTDGLPIPELTARVQSMQQMSARQVGGAQGEASGTHHRGIGESQRQHAGISGNMEHRARLGGQEASAARRSEEVEVEYSSRPPTPPPKEEKRPATPKTGHGSKVEN